MYLSIIWGVNEKAQKSLEKAIEKNPKKSLSYLLIWWVYFDLWDMVKSLNYIEKAESLVDGDIILWKLEKKKIIEDIESIKKSIKNFNSLFE